MTTTATAVTESAAAESAAAASSSSSSWIDYDISAEFLQRELAAAERALQHNEERRKMKKQKHHQNVNDDSSSEEDNDDDDEDDAHDKGLTLTSAQLLSRMDRAASELVLVKDISDWSKNSRQSRRRENEQESGKEEQEGDENNDDFWTARCCEALGCLLVRHATQAADDHADNNNNSEAIMNNTTCTSTTLSLYSNLVQHEYLPLHEYIYMTLILSLRRTLRASGYPAKESCTDLLNQADDCNDGNSSNINNIQVSSFIVMAETAKYLIQLASTHKSVLEHVLPKIQQQQQSQTPPLLQQTQRQNVNVVLIELMRPIVERVRYHFVESSSSNNYNNSSSSSHESSDLTFARLDRLPEWLLRYLKDTIFGQGGATTSAAVDDSPFDVVNSLALYIHSSDTGAADDFVLDFMNEVVRLVQWVFTARGFFQHASVAGPQSKPVILMNAIEQFIQFDALLRSLVPRRILWNHRLLTLMDIFVAGNDELCTWWLERERESLYYTIFNGDDKDDDTNNNKNDNSKNKTKNRLLTLISPRTEVFCALVQSVQQKALQFNYFSIPYLQHVATPLCMQFLDAIHEKANALKSTLCNKPSRHLSLLEANAQLENCIRDWMELINGTHLCAATILRRNGGGSSSDNQGDYTTTTAGLLGTDPDLERIGKSLQHVESVLCDEFCSMFVESVLLERAKLAVYLMKCSHILCSADNNHVDDMVEVSHDLQESWRLLSLFLQVCDEPEHDGPPPFPLLQQDEYNNGHALACHAPRRLRHGVLDLLSEKFLEVALDPHEMSSPDILQAGCRIFLSDMQAYFGFIPSPERVPKSCLRLLNVAQIMATPSVTLAAIGNALVELVQVSPPLHVESFTMDEQLYNQAMSMIQAKGWVWIEDLNDVLSILNRRRDLMNSEAF